MEHMGAVTSMSSFSTTTDIKFPSLSLLWGSKILTQSITR